MRITIRIDDQVHAEAMKWVAEEGTTLTTLIEDSLRAALARWKSTQRRKRFRMPTYGGEGVHTDVDLDNSASLLDRMEDIDDAD